MNAYEDRPATLDGRPPCRNYPRCRRQAIDHTPYCSRCFEAALTDAFGRHVEQRAHVERLSASMPELQTIGRATRSEQDVTATPLAVPCSEPAARPVPLERVGDSSVRAAELSTAGRGRREDIPA